MADRLADFGRDADTLDLALNRGRRWQVLARGRRIFDGPRESLLQELQRRAIIQYANKRNRRHRRRTHVMNRITARLERWMGNPGRVLAAWVRWRGQWQSACPEPSDIGTTGGWYRPAIPPE